MLLSWICSPPSVARSDQIRAKSVRRARKHLHPVATDPASDGRSLADAPSAQKRCRAGREHRMCAFKCREEDRFQSARMHLRDRTVVPMNSSRSHPSISGRKMGSEVEQARATALKTTLLETLRCQGMGELTLRLHGIQRSSQLISARCGVTHVSLLASVAPWGFCSLHHCSLMSCFTGRREESVCAPTNCHQILPFPNHLEARFDRQF